MLSDLDMWNLVIAFVSSTIIIPIIQRPYWSSEKRATVAGVYCIVAGLGTAYFTGGFDGVHDARTAIQSVLVTFVAAIVFYRNWSKPSNIAPRVEQATTPDPK